MYYFRFSKSSIMIGFSRKVYFSFFILLFLSCKKDPIIKEEDFFIEPIEQLSEFDPIVSAAGLQFIEVQWNAVNNTHFKTINYSIYLDDQKVAEGLTETKYSLINLKAGQKYNIKVIASTKEGKKIEKSVSAQTLEASYQEYNIHSYSTLTGPTGLQKSSDGGHFIVRILSHPAYYGGESTKIIVFKIDKLGNMLWYRLLSSSVFNTETSELFQLPLTLHNNEKEIIVFINCHVVKLDSSTGKVLLEKDYTSILSNQSFQSISYINSQPIIAGTVSGNLLAINPQDLSIVWHQNNPTRQGAIIAIKQDSKKNIYYIFQDKNDRYYQIRIHKCNANGVFQTSFLFDGTLAKESDWGFMMTSLVIDEQDNLYLFGHNSDYPYLRYFKFNTEGVVLKKNLVSDNLIAKFAFINDKGDIVVAGRKDGNFIETYGAVYVFDRDLNIKSKQVYNNLPYNIIREITGNSDGSYNIFLNYRSANQRFVYIKTDADGKI